jgi:hypothetical protein
MVLRASYAAGLSKPAPTRVALSLSSVSNAGTRRNLNFGFDDPDGPVSDGSDSDGSEGSLSDDFDQDDGGRPPSHQRSHTRPLGCSAARHGHAPRSTYIHPRRHGWMADMTSVWSDMTRAPCHA